MKKEDVVAKILYQDFRGTYHSTRAGMQQILASVRHKEGQGMIRTIGLLALVIMLMGCATIMHGSSQTVGISSSPSGARVTINGEYRGETPLRVDLARKQDYIIKVEKEGFEPASSTITSKVSGMTFGNIIFGGLIGLAVDAGSGGMYKLSQDDVQITLTKLGAADVTPADVNILSPSPETSETPSITTAQEVFSIPGLGVTLKSEGEILVVGKVHPGGLGEGAGLQAGDRVTKIHGTPVTDRASLVEAVCARDDIWFRIITFKRANETINISFTPGDFECLQPTPSGVGVEGSIPEGEERTTVTQEGLTLARSTKQTMPKSGNWLLGEWVGTRKGTWGDWETTIRITSYDQATNAFKGDGYLVVPNADKWSSVSPIIDLVISAVIDDEGKVVMTIHRDGGKSSSFNLKRKGDASLYGTTAYGPPSLSLKKKR